jgi:type I restriction enzyme S subunit
LGRLPFKPCDNPHYQQLPKGWTLATLKDIGKWQSGATPSKANKKYYNNATIPWLNTGDLNDGEIISIPKSISEIALHETSVKLNPAGSILIAMYGATIGKLGILTFPATTNQACCACVNCVINKQFLFYFLLSHREEFIQMGGGGAQPNISKEKIESTIMPIPPMLEQERIVKAIHIILAKIDTIAANL